MSADKRYSIETRQLNLWYGDFQALINVSVEIVDGLITGLIGPLRMWQNHVAALFQPRERTLRQCHDNRGS